ncbi:carbohydrate porin [Asticcacaulis sp. BYS171W]|uniref:Carbohydrate porin n=1 Tax=Asticcacaulis aquaticus TaxID=2984212 RepID=A0ABT5HXV3_9CAUL|nr:carbohydrate porin [Asticcacaulis aquaticus]MDC7684772.1 carbohydrate porin [Asticcacaulis aquaticus]
MAETRFDAVLTADLLSNTHGGVRQGTRLMGNLDLSAAWSGDNGWEAFAYGLVDAGGGFSETYSGDAQVVSNIDAPKGVRLFEAWVKRSTADEHLSLTAGIINLNGVFDIQETGGLFLNASHGIGPEYAQTGPSIFPIAGLGAVGEWRLSDETRLRAGVFDAVPGDPDSASSFVGLHLSRDEGAHLVAEAEHNFPRGYVKLGAWTYTAKAERLDGQGPEQNNSGYYAQVKYDLYREGTDDQGLAGWLRAGVANSELQPVEAYVGGGLVYTGPFPGRESDAVGLAVAQARFGRLYAESLGTRLVPETTIEVTYRYEIRSGLSVQPDVQYIRHPAGDPMTEDALVVGLRLRVGLEAL